MPRADWVGHVRHNLGTITPNDNTIYDPPIRLLEITGSGTLNVILDGDDETDPASVAPLTVVSGTPLTQYAIRVVRATGLTATVGKGFT
jgi:hypothetical protein